MNAFLYLQKLINPAGQVQILRTSKNHNGDLSFYAPDFQDKEKLIKDKNILSVHDVNGFWNIHFKPTFWQQQLVRFICASPKIKKTIHIESAYIISFQGLYTNLMAYYEGIFKQPYNMLIQATPDLTNHLDLAIIKDIIEWEFRHIILQKTLSTNDIFIQQFFDWWQSYKNKGSVLRIIDPKDVNKTNERMLFPAAYNKIIKDISV